MEGDAPAFLVRGRMAKPPKACRCFGQERSDMPRRGEGSGGAPESKAVITDGPQSALQDMAQETGGEFRASDGFDARGVTVGAVLVAEGDMGVGDVPQIVKTAGVWLM